MSKQKEVLEMSAKLWNLFLEIPEEEKHSDDTNDFRFHIHAIQNILFAQEYKKKDGFIVEIKGNDLLSVINKNNDNKKRF